MAVVYSLASVIVFMLLTGPSGSGGVYAALITMCPGLGWILMSELVQLMKSKAVVMELCYHQNDKATSLLLTHLQAALRKKCFYRVTTHC